MYHAITLLDNDNDNVPGWKKSSLFLRKNKHIKIEKGIEGLGNLYNPENFKYFSRVMKNKIDFITADGGFDFSINFNNQEAMAIRLIFTEVIYAIMLQKKEGSFVIKMFDTFLKSSVDILYLLSTMYENIYICKPNTSRTANSERYIVCVNFKFKQSVEEINSIIGSQQIDNILTTIRFIENKERRGEKIQKIKNNNIQKCINWCIKNKIPHHKIQQNTNIFMTNRKITVH